MREMIKQRIKFSNLHQLGGSCFCECRMRKKGYTVLKKITLRCCGIIDDSKIYYRSKLELHFHL